MSAVGKMISSQRLHFQPLFYPMESLLYCPIHLYVRTHVTIRELANQQTFSVQPLKVSYYQTGRIGLCINDGF